MLSQLAYMSTTTPWSPDELLGLLRQARSHNFGAGITGVLLHRNSGFVQLLEGDGDELGPLFGRIRVDPRHTGVHQIWSGTGESRWFPGWFMAFRDLEEDPITESGLIDVFRGPPDASAFTHEVVLQLWRLLRRSETTVPEKIG